MAISELDPQRADTTVSDIREQSGKAIAISCDVSDRSLVEAATARTLDEYGQIDILINNAVSPYLTGSLEELDDVDWDRNFNVKLKGSFYCLRAVVPHMKERHYGKVVSMASIVGRRGSAEPKSAAYSASKAGTIGLTANMARELGPLQYQRQHHCSGQHQHSTLTGSTRRLTSEPDRSGHGPEKAERSGRQSGYLPYAGFSLVQLACPVVALNVIAGPYSISRNSCTHSLAGPLSYML